MVGLKFIPHSEILYCEASGAYTKFYMKDNNEILVSKNLKEYENILPSSSFMRVHNSFLINLQAVKKFVKSEYWDLKASLQVDKKLIVFKWIVDLERAQVTSLVHVFIIIIYLITGSECTCIGIQVQSTNILIRR